MKLLLLLLPGLCEPTRAALGGRTALQAADTPALDGLARAGRVGRVRLAPAGRLPEDGAALLSLLGRDPRRERAGRGTLEAAGLGVGLAPDDLALRLDLVTTWRGQLVDPWVGGIGAAEARLLVAALQQQLGGDGVEFHAGRGPRNLLVLRGGAGLDLVLVPPGRVPGGDFAAAEPSGADAGGLLDLMAAAGPILARHDVNRVRIDLGERPADAIWPWGKGGRWALEPFALATGRRLAVLARGAAPRGLGVLLGADLPPAPAVADGPAALLAATGAALDAADVLLLHVEGPGEAQPDDLAELDGRLVAPLVRRLAERADARLLITTDRPSPALDPAQAAPFLLWGPGVAAGRGTAFHERAAAAADLDVTAGHALLEHALATGDATAAERSA